jgi:peptide/nickel transport system permease protein
MSRYILSRLLATLPVLFVISLLGFGLEALAPGNTAEILLRAEGVEAITPEAVAAKRAELGLDDPLPVRYGLWLAGAVRGDLGRSFRTYSPVTELYAQRFGNTALLAACAVTLSAVIAIPLGVLAAYRRGRAADLLAQLVALAGAAAPGFWLAFVLVYFFAVRLRWLPVFGTPTLPGIVLPAVVLALGNLALLTRLVRATTLEILGQDYVRVARAKGLRPAAILGRHVLANAFAPIATVIGLEAAQLMTGAAVVEYVFAWPGIGKLAVDSALARDTPVVVGFAVAAGLIYVVVNLLVDVAVAARDPRLWSV